MSKICLVLFTYCLFYFVSFIVCSDLAWVLLVIFVLFSCTLNETNSGKNRCEIRGKWWVMSLNTDWIKYDSDVILLLFTLHFCTFFIFTSRVLPFESAHIIARNLTSSQHVGVWTEQECPLLDRGQTPSTLSCGGQWLHLKVLVHQVLLSPLRPVIPRTGMTAVTDNSLGYFAWLVVTKNSVSAQTILKYHIQWDQQPTGPLQGGGGAAEPNYWFSLSSSHQATSAHPKSRLTFKLTRVSGGLLC